jgi:hypothetical protein
MILRMKKLFVYILLILSIVNCKEKYLPPITSPATGYLVVEGFINSGLEPTSITLTRTNRLYDTANIVYEHNAAVEIESENNEIFPLPESGNGVYVSLPLSLNKNEKYRLRINTQDGKEYVSDFTPVKSTPPIDDITWKREDNGLKIYVNTHDSLNNIKYYQWTYEETWEIHSAYISIMAYIIDPTTNLITGITITAPPIDSSKYTCWQSENSTDIILGSSEKLSTAKIYLPILSIKQGSEKLSVLYSINVKQYALSHDAYLFHQKIKKNTEQLGSIFDPQPSELKGNIHCITNPAEIVVGFVDISEEQKKRIFISNAQVPDWNYNTDCHTYIIPNQADNINLSGPGLVPLYPRTMRGLAVIDFYASTISCVDCTTRGTNIKPSFWP